MVTLLDRIKMTGLHSIKERIYSPIIGEPYIVLKPPIVRDVKHIWTNLTRKEMTIKYPESSDLPITKVPIRDHYNDVEIVPTIPIPH